MPAASALPLAKSAPMSPPPLPSRKARVVVLVLTAITVLGAALRLWHLGSKSLWLDEGATVALARMSWRHFAWVWWHGEANLQTIYFLLMRGWIHLGASEAWIRLPSALFGIASIPVMYLVARKFMAQAPALAAAALLALNPTHIYYSQEARSYSLTILLVLLSSYFFVRAVEVNCRKDWVLWTVLGILAVYSHYFAALVMVAQACSLFFKRKPTPWRPMILGGVVILAAAIPGLTYVFRASPENLHFIWMPPASLKAMWHLAMFFGGSGSKIALALLLWMAGIVAMVSGQRRVGDEDDYWRRVLVLLWFVVPVALIALASLRHPIFLQRYMVFSLPATILLAAFGMDALRKWKIGPILVIALCVMSLPAIVKGYHKPREDWRGASNAVLASATPGDAVVFFPFYTRIMFDYYHDRPTDGVPAVHVFAPAFYDGGEDAHDLLKVLDRSPRAFPHVWILMADHGTKMETFTDGAAMAETLQSIFGAPEVRKFADIDVLEFGK